MLVQPVQGFDALHLEQHTLAVGDSRVSHNLVHSGVVEVMGGTIDSDSDRICFTMAASNEMARSVGTV